MNIISILVNILSVFSNLGKLTQPIIRLSLVIFVLFAAQQGVLLKAQVVYDYYLINQLLDYNCITPQNIYYYQIASSQKTSNGTNIAVKKSSRIQEDSTNILTDTTDKRDRIVSLRQVGDVHILKIELRDYKSEISIAAYNLLGKKVMDIYKGVPKNPDYPYEIASWKLPNGIYICTLLGKDFRKSEKFIVAR